MRCGLGELAHRRPLCSVSLLFRFGVETHGWQQIDELLKIDIAAAKNAAQPRERTGPHGDEKAIGYEMTLDGTALDCVFREDNNRYPLSPSRC